MTTLMTLFVMSEFSSFIYLASLVYHAGQNRKLMNCELKINQWAW